MIKTTEPYLAYLVRFQFANAPDGSAWRVSVQQTGREEPRYFPDLKHYFEFVTQQTETLVLSNVEVAVVSPSTPSNLQEIHQ